jgi:aryl-alcohol dehydrogenase-like predicted oxidoreductase
MDTLEPLLEVMRRIAKAHDVPVSAVALGWVMAKGAIPLGGARNKSQAEQVSGSPARDGRTALDI